MLPAEVPGEVRGAMGRLPLVEHDPCRQYLPKAYCSDDLGCGHALHVANGAPGEFRAIGAWRERWRFRVLVGGVEGGDVDGGDAMGHATSEPAAALSAELADKSGGSPRLRGFRGPPGV